MSISILEVYNKQKKLLLAVILFAAAFNIYTQPYYDEISGIPLVLDKIDEDAWVCVISETRSINDVSTAYFALLDGPKIKYLIGNGCNPLDFNYVILGPIDKTWREKSFLRSRSVLETSIDQYSVIYKEGEVSLLKKK